MNMIEVYNRLMAKVAQMIVNRSLSELEFERETLPAKIKLAKYIRERFNRYLKSGGVALDKDHKRVVVFIRDVDMFQF